MTRVFHGLAGILLVATLWLLWSEGMPPVRPDAKVGIDSVFAKAGFSPIAMRAGNGGVEFTFSRPDCSTPTSALLLTTIHRDAGQAIASASRPDADPLLVYDGKVVPDLAPSRILWPWLWRKARTALGLADASPWDSTALVVFFPRSCPIAAPDWKNLDSP